MTKTDTHTALIAEKVEQFEAALDEFNFASRDYAVATPANERRALARAIRSDKTETARARLAEIKARVAVWAVVNREGAVVFAHRLRATCEGRALASDDCIVLCHELRE